MFTWLFCRQDKWQWDNVQIFLTLLFDYKNFIRFNTMAQMELRHLYYVSQYDKLSLIVLSGQEKTNNLDAYPCWTLRDVDWRLDVQFFLALQIQLLLTSDPDKIISFKKQDSNKPFSYNHWWGGVPLIRNEYTSKNMGRKYESIFKGLSFNINKILHQK